MERNRSIHEILCGEAVRFVELRPKDYWETYEGLRVGKLRGQHQFSMPEVDLVGGLIITAVHPIEIPLTPEQQHLLRPSDTREGRRQMEAQQQLTI